MKENPNLYRKRERKRKREDVSGGKSQLRMTGITVERVVGLMWVALDLAFLNFGGWVWFSALCLGFGVGRALTKHQIPHSSRFRSRFDSLRSAHSPSPSSFLDSKKTKANGCCVSA